MSFSSWLRKWKRPAARRHAHTPTHRPFGFRPWLEALEDRWVLSTLTVTNINDSGAGSLRGQIAAANSGDTIVFDSGLADQTILTGDLVINKSLTIEGTPGHSEAISAYSSSRVLYITGAANVTLDNLVIENGLDVEGAGIYNDGGTLTINDSNVSGNSTDSPYYNGGGIYNNGGTVTINNSTLANNYAQFHYSSGGGDGGGIYNYGGTVTINNSTLANNVADFRYLSGGGTSGGHGGGIYNYGGTVTINDSTLSGNVAYLGGAGIYNTAGGTVLVENSSSVTGNIGGYPNGADVYNLGVVYLDGTSSIGDLYGNPAIPFNPNAPQLQINNVAVSEGNTGSVAANFTVTLSVASTQTITVAYATASGTAAAGSDYQAASGTLTFAPGKTSKTVSVLVYGDRPAEPNESFFVNLSGAANAIITVGHGIGSIVDDEPRISISDVTKAEGNRGQTTLFTFTVTLSATYDQAVTMSFRTVNGTATSGSDYVAKTGTITFNPGETSKTITIEVKGDSKKETNETFYLDLFGNSSNSLFTKNRGYGTILNDD